MGIDASAPWCVACLGRGPAQCEDPRTCGSPTAHRIRRQFAESNMAEALLRRFAESDEYTHLGSDLLCLDGYWEISDEERAMLVSLGYAN